MKNMKLKLIFLSIFCLAQIILSQTVCAQQSQGLSDYDIATKSTSFYPVSVSASQLFRKIPEQIDYATGRATVRIPIYEIETADFTLPISLCYVTSGIKINQLNGTVGLGWQLEAEPMVTRKVRGFPDEDYLLQDASAHRNNSESYRLRLATGRADLQEDLFYYRLLGSRGKFALQESDNRSFLPRLLTTSQAKISSNGPITTGFYNPIYITDASGNRYVFGGEESSRESTFQNNRLSVTAWKASEIVSPSGEKITFGYGGVFKEYTKCDYDFYTVEDGFLQNVYVPDAIPPHPGYWKGVDGKMNYYYLAGTDVDANGNRVPVIKKWDKVFDKPYAIPGSRVEARPLKTITFPGGKVTFYYNASSSMLETIDVTDSNSKLVKRVKLKTRHHGLMKYYYLLDDVEVCGTDGTVLERYHLDYNSGSYWENEKGVDYWGYYNGSQSNTDRVARQTIPLNLPNGNPPYYISIGGAPDKEGNSRSEVFMLRKITYPSGGSTEYIYETNKVYLPQPLPESGAPFISGGGPRLRTIVESPVKGNPVIRSFCYGSDKEFDGIGYSRFPVCPDAFRLSLDKHYITPAPSTVGVLSGKSRTYSNMDTRSSDMNVYYPCVGEIVNGVLTVHYFNNRSSLPCGESSYPLEPLDNADLLAREDSSCNYYKGFKLSSTSVRGKGAYHTVTHMKPFSTIETGYDPLNSSLPLSARQLFLNSYRVETRSVVADEEGPEMTETVTLHNGTPHRQTEYRDYLAGSRLLRRIRRDDETVEFTYPSDKAGSPYSQMVARNVMDLPVETRHYVDGTLRKRIRYNYRSDASAHSGYSLSTVEESTDAAGAQFREVERYSDYLPCGKPCQLVRLDGTVATFVWSYGGTRLIAAVEGMYASGLREAGIDLVSISGLQAVPESIYSRLDALRGSSPQAEVTTYRYLPLTGLTQITAPDGTSTYFRYDTAGRLSEVLDNQLHKQSTYEYHETYK